MHTRRPFAALMAVVVLALGLAVPGTAATPQPGGGDPAVTDVCGDILLYAEGGGQTAGAPHPRDRPLDIRDVVFASVYDEQEEQFLGMDVTLGLCMPAAHPATDEGFRVSWEVASRPGYDEDCSEWVTYFRGRTLGPQTYAAARYGRACVLNDPVPQTGFTFYGEEDLSITNDIDVSGDTITWRLRPDRIAAPLADGVTVGRLWAAPQADTRGTVVGGASTTLDGGTATATVAPLTDDAGPGTDVTVGHGER